MNKTSLKNRGIINEEIGKMIYEKYGSMRPTLGMPIKDSEPQIFLGDRYSSCMYPDRIEIYDGDNYDELVETIGFKVYNCKTHSLVEIIGTIPEQHRFTPEEQAYINQRIEYFKRDREKRISEGNYPTEPYKHNLRKWSKKPSLWSKIKSVFPK